MRIETFVAGGTIPVLLEPPTFRHAPEVVLVEEFAGIAFFAEASEPVLAYGGKTFTVSWVNRELWWGLKVEGGGGRMAKRTVKTAGTSTWRQRELADLLIFVDLDAEL